MGWFDAFASLSGGLGQGLNRFIVQRQLDENTALRLKQQEFENQMAMQQQARANELMGLQKQQIQGAILRQDQDQLASMYSPGQRLDDATMQQFKDKQLTGLTQGVEWTNPNTTVPNPVGQMPMELKDLAGNAVQGAPMGPKSVQQLPDQPTSQGNIYMGTPQQKIEQYKANLPMLQRQQLAQAIMGMNVDPQTRNMMLVDALDGNFSGSAYMNRGGQFGNTQTGTLANLYATGNTAGAASFLKAAADLDAATPAQRAPMDPNLSRFYGTMADRNQLDLDTSNRLVKLRTTNPKFASFVDAIANNPDVPNNNKQLQLRNLTMYAENGQWGAMKDTLKQLAIQNASAPESRAVSGRIAALEQIDLINKQLDWLETKGIPSGLLNGSLEGVLNYLGKTKDPDIARAKSVISQAMMTYRQSMSGAAFSGREADQYARVYPDYANEMQLNRARMDGLRDAMTLNNKTFFDLNLGPDGSKLVNGVLYIESGKPFLFNDNAERDAFIREVQAERERVGR